VRLIGAAEARGAGDALVPQLPLTLDVTLGGFPGPWATLSVVRVQIEPPVL
jgi:hypothetical protein